MNKFTFELLNMVVDEISSQSQDEEINEYLIFELEEENDNENDEIDENYRPIYCIAEDILNDWGDKINSAAQPYLCAMLETEANQEEYGADSLDEIISYFLSNSLTYHTNKAREYKKELRNFLKILRKKRENI